MWALGFLMQSFTQVRMCIYYPFNGTLFDCHSQLFTHASYVSGIGANVISWMLVGYNFVSTDRSPTHCTGVIILFFWGREKFSIFTTLTMSQICAGRRAHFNRRQLPLNTKRADAPAIWDISLSFIYLRNIFVRMINHFPTNIMKGPVHYVSIYLFIIHLR